MKAMPFAPATGRNIRIGRRALGRSVREALSWVIATLHAWSRRRRDRAELARLERVVAIARAKHLLGSRA